MTRPRSFRRRAALAPALLLLLAAALFASGCAGDAKRLARAREARTVQAYEEFLASNPAEPHLGLAKEELAALRFQELGPSPAARDLAALRAQFPETAFAKETIDPALSRAEYDEILRGLRTDPAKLFPALRAWVARHGKDEPALARAVVNQLNEAILDRMGQRGVGAEEALRLLTMAQRPLEEEAFLRRLAKALGGVAPDTTLLRAAGEFQPPWMSREGRSVWVESIRDAFGANLTSITPPTLLLGYLRAFETNPPTAAWERARILYDDARASALLADPSRPAAEAYLADKHTYRLKEELRAQLAAFDAALAKESLSELEAFLASNPRHLLVDDVRRAVKLRREYEGLRAEKESIVAAIGRVDRPAPVIYKRTPTPVPPSLFERALVSVRIDDFTLATLALRDSGLLLAFDERLARAGAGEGIAEIQGLPAAKAQVVGGDPERGFVLLRLAIDRDELKSRLPAIRFMDSRVAKTDLKVVATGLFQGSLQPVQAEGVVTGTGKELRGTSAGQTIRARLVRPFFFDSGFLFNDAGEAVGVLTRPDIGRDILAIGLAEAAPLIERHYDRLLQDLLGAGPERPSLMQRTP